MEKEITRKCSKCGVDKTPSEFRKNQYQCKPCHSASVIEWQRNNKERVREKSKRWYQNPTNRAKSLEGGRKRWKNISPEQKRRKYDATNARHKIMLYGITSEQINEMVSKQKGVCALCGKLPTNGRWKKLVVDHDHQTGKIRGLLCNPCNVGLGALGDTIESIERAMSYLSLSVVR